MEKTIYCQTLIIKKNMYIYRKKLYRQLGISLSGMMDKSVIVKAFWSKI